MVVVVVAAAAGYRRRRRDLLFLARLLALLLSCRSVREFRRFGLLLLLLLHAFLLDILVFFVVLGVLACCLRLPASFRAFFPARDLYLVRLSVACCAELADDLV